MYTMPSFLITPTNKKSLVETTYYKKHIDDVCYTLIRETIWRSGSFIIHVPTINLIPIKDNAFKLDDYDYEFQEAFDACQIEDQLFDEDGNLVEEGPIYDEVMRIIDDDINLLDEDYGWNIDDNQYVIYNGYKFLEVIER